MSTSSRRERSFPVISVFASNHLIYNDTEADQTRHGAEAQSDSESGSGFDTPSLHEAIQDAHERLDADKIPENSMVRDAHLAALIHGLEETNQLADIVDDAGSVIDRDVASIDATRAATHRLLVRVGLQEVAPRTIQTTIEARREYLAEQADEF